MVSQFLFCTKKSIDLDEIGELVGYSGTIFYKQPSFDMAKEKFLEKARKEYYTYQSESNKRGAIVARLEEQEDIKIICKEGK